MTMNDVVFVDRRKSSKLADLAFPSTLYSIVWNSWGDECLLKLVVAASVAQAAAPTPSEVRLFTDGSVVPGAYSTLRTSQTGAGFTLHTAGLPPGDAVTVWWVIFNKPQNCAGPGPGHPFRCDASDLSNPAVQASVQLAAGHVVGTAGPVTWAGHLATGDTTGCAFGAFLCAGLRSPTEADIHLIVHDHGPADPAIVSDEIHSFGVCNPTCTDLQFSVHQQ
jgi:hypothetical protein